MTQEMIMRDPFEIEVTGLLEGADGEIDDAVAAIISAVRRAHHDERTTWLMFNGLRCAAIVPLEVGRVSDPDELPRPGSVNVTHGSNGLGGIGWGGGASDWVPGPAGGTNVAGPGQ